MLINLNGILINIHLITNVEMGQTNTHACYIKITQLGVEKPFEKFFRSQEVWDIACKKLTDILKEKGELIEITLEDRLV